MDFPVINMKKTGQWIRFLCKKENVSVSELQDRLKISSNQAIYAWFNGKTLPSVDNLLALSRLLRVSMDDMLVLDGTMHPFLRGMGKEERRVFVYTYKLITVAR
ncbi:MAG: helix-turn-helix transcriptional regulator [Lachnospiraceae bacterium]|nr:helix-turn-helix transcriptional regulator [Lachnospiraceae bacterium]